MANFWEEWPLWEKMTFVLALSIFAALCLGLCKNVYTRWKLRSYANLAAATGEVTPNMIEAQRAYNDEIPFGIRALERGVEVQGVWISQPNTPLDRSPASSFAATRNSETIPTLSLTLPEGSHQLNEPQPTHSSSRSIWSDSHRERSKDRSSSSKASREYSRQSYSTSRTRPASLPIPSNLRHSIAAESVGSNSYLEFDTNRFSNLSTSSGEGLNQRGASPTSSRDSHDSSNGRQQIKGHLSYRDERRGSGDAITPKGKGKERLVDARADLDLLQTHRLSHAAETGQLTPRSRHHRFWSREWLATSSPKQAPPSPDPLPTDHPTTTDSYFPIISPTRTDSQALPGGTEAIEPTFSSLDLYSKSFTHEVASAQDMGKIRSVGNTYPSFSWESLEIPEPTPETQRKSHEPNSAFETPTKRNSQILRKVNSAFEIMKPGTFTPKSYNTSSPALRHTDGNRRRSRKLQKKYTPDGERKRSSFIEHIYGNERHPQQ
ncbi:hypothetical protein EJ08DRAFT_735412 [Tothia fuscella]|uniref:Uncharacterized protein n=1 Tax=Tothia fuscella TaxID=1048955 RepID=A0A9P4TX44_9PEZI|nr:hypothetical protein EJ08DRAFT_735412 [Tothia fuscella]